MKDQTKLISRIQNGDKVAFKLLYDLNAKRIFNIAISYVKNLEEAEEITQDVFTKIFINAKQFKKESKVSTWIYRIAVNTSLNYIKRKRTIPRNSLEISEVVIADFNHPGVRLEDKEKAMILFAAISQLAKNQETAFILSYIEGMPRQEVADIMNMSLKAIESLLQRAKSNLRKLLGDHFDNRRKTNKK